MTATISGILSALVGILLSAALSKHYQIKLLAGMALAAMAFIYVGFSLQDGSARSIIIESAAAIGFYFLVIVGFSGRQEMIAYGIILHGIWDLFHHEAVLVETMIPTYWPAYCSVIDFIWGVCLIIYLKGSKKVQLPAI